MSLRYKLLVALGCMMLVCVVVAGTGLYITRLQAQASERILKDNFRSIQYCSEMLKALEAKTPTQAINGISKPLAAEMGNLTEPGEDSLANLLATKVKILPSSNSLPDSSRKEIAELIFKIQGLNMQAMQQKDEKARDMERKGYIFISVVFSIGFLVLMVFAFNFPSAILEPITEVTLRMEEIAEGNYSQSIFIENKHETGQMAKAFNAMVAELDRFRKSNLAEVLFEKTRLQAILDNLRDPLIILNQHEELVFANSLAIGIYFSGNKPVVGTTITSLMQYNDLLRHHWELIKTGESPRELIWDIYSERKTKHFNPEWLKVEGIDPRNNTKQFMGHVLRLRDVTDVKELELAKTGFLATISHELKTPLSATKLSLKLLKEENDVQRQGELINHINVENQRMLKLVNDLLSLIRLENSKEMINRTEIEIDGFLHSLALTYQPETESKQIFFSIPESGIKINSDAAKLALALKNLLGNAIKYAPENSVIQIMVKMELSKAIISVSDDGNGVDPEILPHLFSRFNSDGTGSGLGLALTREIITQLNGETGYTRSDNKSTFWIKIPVG